MGLLHTTLHALRRANGADVKAERQLGYHIAETVSKYFKVTSCVCSVQKETYSGLLHV